MLHAFTNNLHPKILIADDDVFTAKVYKKYLSKANLEVNLVHNGLEVLNYLKWETPHLIMLDLMMPIMDGFQTLESLKQKNLFDPRKIIVISSLSNSDDMAYIKSFGISEYIIKQDLPIQSIYQIIKKYL